MDRIWQRRALNLVDCTNVCDISNTWTRELRSECIDLTSSPLSNMTQSHGSLTDTKCDSSTVTLIYIWVTLYQYFKKMKITRLEAMLLLFQLRCFWHVSRMKNHRLPKRFSYGNLSNCYRGTHRAIQRLPEFFFYSVPCQSLPIFDPSWDPWRRASHYLCSLLLWKYLQGRSVTRDRGGRPAMLWHCAQTEISAATTPIVYAGLALESVANVTKSDVYRIPLDHRCAKPIHDFQQ